MSGDDRQWWEREPVARIATPTPLALRILAWGRWFLLGALLIGLPAGCALTAAEVYAGQPGRWVEVVATAYSPHDEIDRAYHETKGRDRWRTRYGTDVRIEPYGIAAPEGVLAGGARILVPRGLGYLDETSPAERVFVVDDVGGRIASNTAASGVLHIDLRYRTERSARQWGVRRLRVFILDSLDLASR